MCHNRNNPFRLWQIPDIRILLIEAGSGDHHWSIRMRVHGIAGLRVADASVMPAITTGNINAPSMMIGERAAELIATAPTLISTPSAPDKATG